MALRPGSGGGGSFMYPVGGGLGPPQGMMPMQQQQQPQQQQAFPMVPVMQPNMQGMMGMNFGGQMAPGAMAMQGGMPMGMQAPGMQFMGQPQFMGMRAPGPQYPADLQKQMAEEHQKRLEQQQRLLEEDRKRRQFEEQKQKLRLLSSVKPKTGEKSRDDALEAIKGNLDGFSRDARMHPTPSSQSKKPDSSPLHSSSSSTTSSSSSAPPHSLPPAFPEDNDEFSDFMQGPVEASSTSSSSSSSAVPQPSFPTAQLPPQGSVPAPNPLLQSQPTPTAVHHSSVISSSQSAFQAGVGVYPQQEHLQPMVPSWLYNDSLIPEMFKKVLEFTMTPAGIDTAKLYPILMSSGLPREALGQIWAQANRTTPGKLTKEELYTVLALIGVAQSGIPVMSPDILNQFPSPPVPNLPGLTMAMPAVMSQHQPPIMAQPPVSMAMQNPTPAVSMAMPTAAPAISMAMPTPVAPVIGMTPNPPTAQPTSGFIASFPPVQGTKAADDDDFQDFQEAPKAGGGDDSFADFQSDSGSSFPAAAAPQSSAPAMLTPVSGSSSSSSSDKYAAFKQMSVEQPPEPAPPASDGGDKYSVFRSLEPTVERKPVGEGFADFKSVSVDDGFTDFKTADSVSPLEPPDPAKVFQPAFPPPTFPPQPHSLSQQASAPLSQPPRNPLNMADLDLFSSAPSSSSSSSLPTSARPAEPQAQAPSLLLPPAQGGTAGTTDDFGDFALFGSSSSADAVTGSGTAGVGSVLAAQQQQQQQQDDFADFLAFGSSSESHGGSGGPQRQPSLGSCSGPDRYDVFKQLSLEGGLGSAYNDDNASGNGKDSIGGGCSGLSGGGLSGSFSSPRGSDVAADDFADFQASRLGMGTTALGGSVSDRCSPAERAFRQAKEDSASVKSLDLPSLGGSSSGGGGGREEDALSLQLDLKLVEAGGDLRHGASDSSLDLPGLSAHQPHAADSDDLKFDPFGTASSSRASYDWSDREDLSSGQDRRPQTTAQRQETTSFGSSESVTQPSVPKVTTFPSEDSGSSGGGDRFEAFARFGTGDGEEEEDDFGDFASTVSEKSDSPPVATETGSEVTAGSEGWDEFGAFQGDKPKFGKLDFLKASSQTKVKSSEEMIKNELATFDLSVQGSHKRSHSLGEKELGPCSAPSPAPEAPFRDRSSTLSDKPTLPVIRDKYKDLTGEVEESERYAYEWQRCLECALQVITTANNTLNGISSSTVCTEVIQSAQGMEYLLGVVEVYRVTKRVELGIKATAVCSEKLQELLKNINRVWNNLMGFMSLANLTPDESSLDFSSCILRPGIKNAKELACGVCLLNVDSRSKKKEERGPLGRLFKRAFNSETDNFKLTYGGHQYHASCANFWINCVEPKPPGLILPDLL
ncbi:synergin gamma isoform X4 [Alosa pseudoharengus]|uniref:synergin gamma isoform X4 n=1 Tax=Alosa pseudoharengus TaxID=34774 RepID=UPI003F899C78